MSTKRAVELAEKLQFSQNERLRPRVVEWVKQSEEWATGMFDKYGPNQAQKDVAGYRLLYILNHLCPSLHHFHKMPNPLRFRGDIDGYNRAAMKHWRENTQAGLQDQNGAIIQEGVQYDKENLEAFIAEARKYCDFGTIEVKL